MRRKDSARSCANELNEAEEAHAATDARWRDNYETLKGRDTEPADRGIVAARRGAARVET